MKLEDHLDQLQVLEDRIPRKLATSALAGFVLDYRSMSRLLQGVSSRPNPMFPNEDVQAFTLRMFDEKKKLIARELGLPG